MTASLAPNAILQNRYQIIRLLGEGGFGAVYQAWDLRLQGHVVAVKENFDNTSAAQTQFQTEAALLAKLNHPALPRVTDYFIEPSGRQYLVMDFVEGNDLEERVTRYGRVPESQAITWITEILNALEYLHAQRPPIIHRDIKPANIKVRPDGKVMLVDFGIAKVYDPTQKTSLGARAVSPGYSPLEQYGKGTTDARSDLYALGATMYFALTGNQPPEATALAAHTESLPLPRTCNPSLTPHVEQVILKAMEIQANVRYVNATVFKQALHVPVVSSPQIAPRVSAPQVQAPNIVTPIPSPKPQVKPPAKPMAHSGQSLSVRGYLIAVIAIGVVSAWMIWATRGMLVSGVSSGDAPSRILWAMRAWIAAPLAYLILRRPGVAFLTFTVQMWVSAIITPSTLPTDWSNYIAPAVVEAVFALSGYKRYDWFIAVLSATLGYTGPIVVAISRGATIDWTFYLPYFVGAALGGLTAFILKKILRR